MTGVSSQFGMVTVMRRARRWWREMVAAVDAVYAGLDERAAG